MLRISMFVVFVALLSASTAVAARDAALGAAGETCAEKQEAAKNSTARASTTRGGVPARETKAKSDARAGSDLPGGRLQSPRWHSFLPGMFR